MDERFSTNSARVRHRDVLVPQIQYVMRHQTTAYWVENLRKIDVPGGPVNSMDQVFAMDQIKAREMQIEMDHPDNAAPLSLVGSPLKLSDTPVSYKYAPPVLGQHTDEVLKTVLKLSDTDIQALKEKRCI